MTVSNPQRLRVAIVGGGIAGLTLAIALSRNAPHLDVVVYEATSTFGAVGAGIGMWPRVWDALKGLGLCDTLDLHVDTSCSDARFHYRKSDQCDGIPFGVSEMPLRSIHRADFLDALLKSPPVSLKILFSKRLTRYTDIDGEQVTLYFTDGSIETCDVLLAADGIKSSVRQQMYHSLSLSAIVLDKPKESEIFHRCQQPTWTGQVAYRAMIPRRELQQRHPSHPSLHTPCIYSGKHKVRHIVDDFSSDSQMVNVVVLMSRPTMQDTSQATSGHSSTHTSTAELLRHFSGWESLVIDLLQMLKMPSRWVINTIESLPTYVSGRVGLLGDAAHAMTPHQASGAGQGIEVCQKSVEIKPVSYSPSDQDAFVLSSLLSLPEISSRTLPLALKVYDEIRRPFSQDILHKSVETGRLYFMQTGTMAEIPTGTPLRKALQKQADDIRGTFKWTNERDISQSAQLAVDLFRKRLHQQTPLERDL
ncbi:hypothetical protein NLI96_g1673 [Meripilus lineatus]|uniref:Salicylate hydroxylase n=1 Tax=Meripilus lineatus TaxID=2056292 RepID=A0AAD5VAB7_9APHY|nr:hypothetical protein NLI96_g1673 [Physisporinus lineatus]